MGLAVLAFVFLPGPPEKTKFLDERERTIATERLRVETAGLVSDYPIRNLLPAHLSVYSEPRRRYQQEACVEGFHERQQLALRCEFRSIVISC